MKTNLNREYLYKECFFFFPSFGFGVFFPLVGVSVCYCQCLRRLSVPSVASFYDPSHRFPRVTVFDAISLLFISPVSIFPQTPNCSKNLGRTRPGEKRVKGSKGQRVGRSWGPNSQLPVQKNKTPTKLNLLLFLFVACVCYSEQDPLARSANGSAFIEASAPANDCNLTKRLGASRKRTSSPTRPPTPRSTRPFLPVL